MIREEEQAKKEGDIAPQILRFFLRGQLSLTPRPGWSSLTRTFYPYSATPFLRGLLSSLVLLSRLLGLLGLVALVRSPLEELLIFLLRLDEGILEEVGIWERNVRLWVAKVNDGEKQLVL